MEYLKQIARISLTNPHEVGGYLINDRVLTIPNIATEPQHTYIPKTPPPANVTLWHSHTKGGFSETDARSIWGSNVPWIVFDKSTLKFHHFNPNVRTPYLGREWVKGLTDCYCLVRDWYRWEIGILLPTPGFYLGNHEKRDITLNLHQILEKNFHRVDKETGKNHDLVIWKEDGKLKHIGVLINIDGLWKILHHPAQELSQLSAPQEIVKCALYRCNLPLPLDLPEVWNQTLVVNLSYRQIDLAKCCPTATTPSPNTQN